MIRKVAKHRGDGPAPVVAPAYPFTAVVGQEEMKLALLLAAVEPAIGGVLVTGHRGTAKSTAVRSLAALLPALSRVRGCAFNCDPKELDALCAGCRSRLVGDGSLPRERAGVPVIDLPLNATEDRLCGTLDIGRALRDGERAFEPGLLARAHRGLLYIDEVNLLEDHLVDLLLDASASGRNRVEREGVSFEHAARFVLVGSSNPEEGELRPQLLDRFGLCVEVRTADTVEERVSVVESREAYDRDPASFAAAHAAAESKLRHKVARARRTARDVRVAEGIVRAAAELCLRLRIDGHRGELTVVRAARALAAFEGRRDATLGDARRVAAMALRHRLRHDPLETHEGDSRVERAVEELLRAGGGDEGGSSGGAEGIGRSSVRSGHSTRRAGGETESAGGRGDDWGRGGNSPDGDGPHSGARDEQRAAVPTDAGPKLELTASESRGRRRPSNYNARSRDRARTGDLTARRGRYVEADAEPEASRTIAADATLRALAARRVAGADSDSELINDNVRPPAASGRVARRHEVVASDLRFKQFARREGTLYVCAVDASGSMAVNRIRQAKGAVAVLLRRSYVRRDRVALVGFSGRGAELLLRPSQSGALAMRRLDELPVGGATPLAAGLLRSLEMARAAARRGARRIVLLVFTDGRANVPLGAGGDAGTRKKRVADEIERLGASLRSLPITVVVVDTRRRFGAGDEGEVLARTLGGRYVRLPASGEGGLPV